MTASDQEARPSVISYPIEAGGVVTRALECGHGDQVIVCLHGAGSRADRWRRNLPGLAQSGFHVYAIDFPGHGFAAKRADYSHGTPKYAEVVIDFLGQIGYQSVNFAATSLGGHVAAWVACHRPKLVRAVALIGAAGLVPIARAAVNSQRVSDTSTAGVRAKLEFLVYDRGLVTDDWVAEEARINTSPGAQGALDQLRMYIDTGIERDLVGEQYAELHLPTLLVWGREDRWVPTEVGLETAKLLPRAPMVILDHAGHAPYYERPQEFNDVLVEFLRDPEGCKPGIRDL